MDPHTVNATRRGSRVSRVVVAAITTLFTACGGAASAPTPALSGEWAGALASGEDGPGTIALQLTQTGLAVDGTVRMSQGGIEGATGTFAGTLATASVPTRLTFVVNYEYGPFHCAGTFSGALTVDTREIAGSFTGQNCVRPFTGSLQATRNR